VELDPITPTNTSETHLKLTPREKNISAIVQVPEEMFQHFSKKQEKLINNYLSYFFQKILHIFIFNMDAGYLKIM
jgi:hypothetical protein